jgi:hypothetical protein
MCQVVLVLYANNRNNSPGFCDLCPCDVAEPDVTDQALSLEVGQNRDWFFERSFGGFMDAEHTANVDYIERI